MRDGFEWDDDKADTNSRIHGVGFDEAADVFYDPNRVELFDEGHSEEEGRYVVIRQVAGCYSYPSSLQTTT